MYDEQPKTGKKGTVASFALVIVWNPETSRERKARFEFQDVAQLEARFEEERQKEAADPTLTARILKALTIIQVEDGDLEDYDGIWLDRSIKVGDPYVQVFCKNDSPLMSRISGECGYAWWPTFGKRIERFFTCDRCSDDGDFDDVAVSMRGRDVHSGTTAEDMPFFEEDEY